MSAKTPAGEIILAIDGGQSSTVCLIGAPDGTLLASGMGGPANLALHRGARPLMRAALEGAVGQACARLDPPAREAQAAYLSLTGGTGLALEMLPQLIPCRRMLAESDTLAALASGTLGGPGIVLIAGTGAVALALDASGRRVVHGGYGFLLGDEGSGYWIGKQAVLGAIRYYDGRGESSDLFPQVLKQLNAAGPRELAGLIYADWVKRRDVAGLCPLVIAAAFSSGSARPS
jgi:glucosamine kinase